MGESTYRSSTTRFPQSYSYTYERADGSTGSGNYIYNTQFTNYRNGQKGDNYKRKIQLRQNATTPLNGIKVEAESKPSYLRVLYIKTPAVPTWKVKQTLTTYCWASLPSDASVKSQSSVQAENEANSLFHLKANEAFREVYTGVIIGELKQTVGLIRGAGKRLVGATLDYHKSASKIANKINRLEKLQRANKTSHRAARIRIYSNELSKLWLEYSFGVRPLVNDIEDVIDYLNNEIERPSKAIRAVTQTNDDVDSTFYTFGVSGAQIRFLRKRTKRTEVMMFGSVSPDGGLFSRGFTRLGLHPKDFAPTIYELLPWSFLLDYFANLNAIIAGCSNAFVNIDWTSKTVRKIYTTRYLNGTPVTYKSNVYPGATIVIDQFIPREPTFKKTWVSRDVVEDVPIPYLDFKLPDSLTKGINIAALILARSPVR